MIIEFQLAAFLIGVCVSLCMCVASDTPTYFVNWKCPGELTRKFEIVCDKMKVCLFLCCKCNKLIIKDFFTQCSLNLGVFRSLVFAKLEKLTVNADSKFTLNKCNCLWLILSFLFFNIIYVNYHTLLSHKLNGFGIKILAAHNDLSILELK